MPFKTKKRGKLTYYYEGEDAVLSAMVVEEQADGDLRIYFSGLTGGYSATSVLNLIQSPRWILPSKSPWFFSVGSIG